MLDDYLARFRAAVAHLEQEPGIRVVLFDPRPPCTDAQLTTWERARGLPLDPSLRAFYRQCNGLMLRWIRADDEHQLASLERVPPEEMHWDYTIGDYPQDQGRVLIRPLEELTPEGFWAEGDDPDHYQDDTTIDGFTIRTADLRRSVLAFDQWSYSTFAVLLPRPRAPWIVLHGSDHGVCFDDDRPCDVETYLELVLACLGHTDIRYRTFRGHTEPRLPPGPLAHAGKAYWDEHPFGRARLFGPTE
jgi:hypothetical protein